VCVCGKCAQICVLKQNFPFVCVYMYVCIYIHIYIYVCVCVTEGKCQEIVFPNTKEFKSQKICMTSSQYKFPTAGITLPDICDLINGWTKTHTHTHAHTHTHTQKKKIEIQLKSKLKDNNMEEDDYLLEVIDWMGYITTRCIE